MCVSMVLAQAPTLTAEASDTRIDQFGFVRITYSTEGGEGSNFRPPDFKDFTVLGGPSRQSTTTIVNGRVSSSFRISYDLAARRDGTFTIPPASIDIGGQRITSNTLQIEVVKADNTIAAKDVDGAEVFAQTTLEQRQAYVGERVLLETQLLNRVDIRTYSLLSAPELGGLQVDQLRRFDNYPRQRNIGGRDYQVTRVQLLEAFATLPGRYEIGTQTFEVGIVEPGGRGGFFFSPPTRPKRINTAPVTLEVLPLPTGAPEDFIGVVGNWVFSGGFRQNPSDISTADALTFDLRTRGRGDASRLNSPALDWPSGWRALPVKTVREESFETDSGMVFVREFEYTIVPERAGNFELAPSLSYFDITSKRYETWRAEPLSLTVRQGKGTRATSGAGDSDSDLAIDSRLPAKPVVIRGFWVSQPWYWALLALLPLSVAATWLYQLRQTRLAEHPAPKVDPLEEGRRRLQTTREQLDAPLAFYTALGTALDRFAQDRLALAQSEQTDAKLRAAFARTGHSDAADAFVRARALADQGRYGGGTDREGRLTALAELERVLSL